jgi:hypothetical protein
MLFSTSKIKDESNVFGHVLNNIGFLIEGTLVRAKSFCDATITKSTVMQQHPRITERFIK